MCPNFWKNQRYGHDPGANVPEVREKSRETVTIRARLYPKLGEKVGKRSRFGEESAVKLGKKQERVTIVGRKCPKFWKKQKKGHNRGKKVPEAREKSGERSQSEKESAQS
ncbi:hypothetical protein [Heyndrickxia camelliae]|uniref:Uncharacterized protein n=1 Tax=Heyndrickxia camelliae TaxID=1707093 RepID=A0A2N3LIL8_9BACI|nr:hypothetical protein [Heyndrickxia camelliae]PKR84472.1 hypothetical protein CWO92_13885 [Heyndrickxia camelliae]